jgi:hypothetical protein
LNIQSAALMGMKGIQNKQKSGKKRKKPEIPTFLALFVLLSFLHPSCLFCIHLSFIDET